MKGDSASSWKSARTGQRLVAVYCALRPATLLWTLVLAMPGSASAQQLSKYPDTALSGSISAELNTTAEGCRALCEGRPSCAGYDHATSTSICRLFVSVSSARSSGNSFAGTREAVAGSQPAFLEYPDTILSGEVSAELTKPLDRCRRICDERSGCVGFDHTAATNTCRMFASVTSARESRGLFASTRRAITGYRPPANLLPPPLPEPSQSSWLHNGSVMTLRLDPKRDGSSKIEIVYDVPKDRLLGIGIRHGTTLFKGTLADGSIIGNARLTSSRCGIIQYEVHGTFDPLSSAPFFLRGAAPKRGRDCTVESWSTTGENANLRFDPR